jgi:hypothetical protein
MNGKLTFPAGDVFGAKMVCLGSVESVDITAGYGPEPDVFGPGLLGDSDPYKLGTHQSMSYTYFQLRRTLPPAPEYLGSSESDMLKMPPAKSPSPFAGKFPGFGWKVCPSAKGARLKRGSKMPFTILKNNCREIVSRIVYLQTLIYKNSGILTILLTTTDMDYRVSLVNGVPGCMFVSEGLVGVGT